ncbi:FAD-binding oxidoreductase [Pseudalkalibacillus salsuginis]|uniref:FAD-binding oxidoreductase n=1 Tax=Pseudalkalibacillus salsuginis TaxID=2910972 RepID=UPI001F41B5C0|nr:FAD-binding oxidoreductase [Pseudalkalibacillus salsuginis]MCF6410172.1 FAD-binding oxidoreductase [Pseudalkalibacillus salsuginis]
MELNEVGGGQLVLSEKYGNTGLSVVTPKSEEEIEQILRTANEEGKKISVMGRGTKRGYGGVKQEYDLVLSLANYKGIIEHIVGDMTVTVRPGTTIAGLQEYLKKYGQMVSIDPSWPEEATIGGVIAANESGPKRLKYGAARDLVIGLRVVYADGSVIRTGGKVVKNVAGYDMNKLFIGSMGTLGVISEITMKLRPLPKFESLVLLSIDEDRLEELKAFTVKLQDSMIEPVSLELVNPSLSKKLLDREEYTLLIAFEDVEKAVRYQEEWVAANKPDAAILSNLSSDESREFWKGFSVIQPNALKENEPADHVLATVKISSKNMQVFDILEEVRRLKQGNKAELDAHGGLGHGLSFIILKGPEESVTSTIASLRVFVRTKQGFTTIKHLPFELRKKIDTWHDNPSYFFLFEGIKRKADPKNTLNYKRFIGGI